jgi:hypothetical protein
MDKTLLHSPLKQFLVIIPLIVMYWSYHVYMEHSHAPEYFIEERFHKGESEVYVEEYSSFEFWDMLLGHVSSILVSVSALGVPLITYYKNKKERQ